MAMWEVFISPCKTSTDTVEIPKIDVLVIFQSLLFGWIEVFAGLFLVPVPYVWHPY